MRKVIPYIASQFRKDKIWLRRTKPSKRDYQICLAVDDSSSMVDNHSKQVRFKRMIFYFLFFFWTDFKIITVILKCLASCRTAAGVRVCVRNRERSVPAGGGTGGSVQVSTPGVKSSSFFCHSYQRFKAKRSFYLSDDHGCQVCVKRQIPSSV